MGCPLFIRSTRRVELTRAGATFYDRAVRILSEMDLTAELTRAAGGSRIRQIKIGTVYPATMGMLRVFLGKIAHKFPDVRTHLRVEEGEGDRFQDRSWHRLEQGGPDRITR